MRTFKRLYCKFSWMRLLHTDSIAFWICTSSLCSRLCHTISKSRCMILSQVITIPQSCTLVTDVYGMNWVQGANTFTLINLWTFSVTSMADCGNLAWSKSATNTHTPSINIALRGNRGIAFGTISIKIHNSLKVINSMLPPAWSMVCTFIFITRHLEEYCLLWQVSTLNRQPDLHLS